MNPAAANVPNSYQSRFSVREGLPKVSARGRLRS